MVIETAKMSARGQVIIPKAIREALGATEDSTLTFVVAGPGHVLVKKLDAERIRKEVEEFWEIRAKSKKVQSWDEINEIVRDARARIKSREGRDRH